MATRKRNPLMIALRFSAQDVKYNREGQMSPAQQARFLRGGRGRAMLTAVVAGISAGIVAQSTREASVLTFYVAQVVNALGFGWLAWSTNMSLFKDGASGRVATVTGKPLVEQRQQRQVLYIGDQPVNATPHVLETLDERKTYHAYIAPHSGRLLALEPEPTSRPKPTTRPTGHTPRFGSRRRY